MSEDAYVYIVEKCNGGRQSDIIQNQHQGEHVYEGLQALASGNHGYKNMGKRKEGTTVVKPSEGKRQSDGRRTCLVVTSLLAVAAVAVIICLTVRLITLQSGIRDGPSLLLDKNISLALTEMAGGKGGHWFTDALYASTGNNLTAINIWAVNNCVYGIQGRYGSSWAPIRGSPSGANYTFELQTGEYITQVDVGTGNNPWNSGNLVVCSLTFYTNVHTYGPYPSFNTSCARLITVNTSQGIAYLAGRLAVNLDAIMFYYYDRVVTSPLYGGETGFQFDDTPYFRANGLMTHMLLYNVSESIVKLFVSYGGVETSSYGGVPPATFTFNKNTLTVGDVINRVNVTWNADRVCSLTFFTPLKGTFPPVQAPSCVSTDSTTVTMNRLLAFYGFYDRQLNAIGFHYV